MCAKTEKENLFEVKLLPLVLKQTNGRNEKECNYHSVCDHNTTLTW
jgi:hypothetical protein